MLRTLDNAALTRHQIANVAPSVFSTHAADDRSQRYTFIPTYDVVEALQGEGFFPVSARQINARSETGSAFGRHELRFRRAQDVGVTARNELIGIPEIVLLNSHDGTSAYKLMAGVFRQVCSNGMVASCDIGEVSVRHSGKVAEEVIDGCIKVVEQADEFVRRLKDWGGINLTPTARNAFATAALGLRYDQGESPIEPSKLLVPQRYYDKGTDLATTVNVVQENLIRGGMRGYAQGKRRTVRAIKGIDQDIRLNRSLMTLAEMLAATEGRVLEVA